MNYSTQRSAILKALRRRTDHPTAEEIFSSLKEELPRLSRGTVYRNLEQMAEAGMILKLEHSGKLRMFDGCPEPHCHLRCDNCGRVSDLLSGEYQTTLELLKSQAEKNGHRTFQLEFSGVCKNCRSHPP